MTHTDLLQKISKQDAVVCVIGLGQVGLPTALTFSKEGFNVIGYDVNKTLIANLNLGKSSFEEKNMGNLLTECIRNKKFHATDDLLQAINDSSVVIVCVPTPLTESIKPDLSVLENVCNSISDFSLSGKLIIIESSIPPGTFSGLVLQILEKKNKLGKDFWAAFVPERLAPGQALTEIQTTPRIIGHVDEESGTLAEKLYEKIVKSQIYLTKVQVAEISKLVENTFRDVNIAFANEVSRICEHYGIDVAELIKVCNSHPRVKLLQPGPGVGGPCLPKDPYLLLNPQGMHHIESPLILESRKINDSMPYHVAEIVANALKKQNKNSESTILILGVTYKADITDVRLSPAKQIISQLVKLGYNVLVYDPNSKETFGGQSVSNVYDAMSSSDAIIVVTDHHEFRQLDLKQIKKSMKSNPIIVDTKRIFPKKEADALGIQYLSIGCI
jgi:UDP-N-acetyl-D-mannosaminuronic acid dehydrogenase